MDFRRAGFRTMVMEITAAIAGKKYRVRLDAAHDISIPVRFDDVQLSVFGTPPARMKALEAGDFIGAVARGGSCNCETYTITPHCNGTHTECIGHITGERIEVPSVLHDSLIPATVISVTPVSAVESYEPPPQSGDMMITRAALDAALGDATPQFMDALVIRTMPNAPDKKTRDYDSQLPPYFSHDAMAFIAGLPVRHLLTDLPSVDRLADEGRLGNHRLFWGVAPGARNAAPSPKTITELVYVPDSVRDGRYILNLQIAAFGADATPSRPLLYEVADE